MGEQFSTSKRVIVKDCKLPQFTSHCEFHGLFHLFKMSIDGWYNAIIGKNIFRENWYLSDL